MEAIILAGGLGTRLRSVVADTPKALSLVNGKPFLSYLLDYLEKQGVKKIIFSTGYLGNQIDEYLKNNRFSFEYTISNEEYPLGTGGAIRKALSYATERDVLIVNGDTFFEVDIPAFYRFHLSKNASCSIALKQLECFDRYGSVILDEKENVIQFEEKKYQEKGLINGGFIWLNTALKNNLDNLPDVFSFEKDFLEKNIQVLDIAGFISSGYFIDIGIPQDYQLAQTQLSGILK